MDELKPCPFCGCKKPTLKSDSYGYGFRIECGRCWIGMQRMKKSRLIKSWNRRVEVKDER